MIAIILVAIGLSMDAFSLSLAYGTLGFSKKERYLLSTIVGLYHFVMPLIGVFLGSNILSLIKINPNIIAFVILFFIGIEMIVNSIKKEVEIKKITVREFFIFGLAVSIDSFSVGIGLEAMTHNFFVTALIFSISSFLFTLLGLHLGYRINNILNKAASLVGGILLVIISFYYLFS